MVQGKISLASSDDIALSLSSKSIDSDYDVPRFRDHPQVRYEGEACCKVQKLLTLGYLYASAAVGRVWQLYLRPQVERAHSPRCAATHSSVPQLNAHVAALPES